MNGRFMFSKHLFSFTMDLGDEYTLDPDKKELFLNKSKIYLLVELYFFPIRDVRW